VTTLQPDWKALTRAIGASQRAITEGLAEFVRLDTVTQNPDGVRTGALWLAQAMRSRGLSAEVMETGGNPVVYGALPLPGARRTVLIYCHYDTKPAPAAGWLQPSPFSPILRRGTAEEGAPILELAEVPDDLLPEHRLYGRGSSDDKGPIWAHLTALELMRAQGMAPRVNLKLIFDGEEETGSQHFGSFTEAQRDLLAADVALVMDGSKDASGRPTVAFGARGVLSLELTLETARRDVHSGNFSVPNPAWRLVGLLASMAAPDGTPLVEGLEDGVVPPTAAERALMDRIPLDRAAIEKELGVALPSEYLERLMFRSTLTIRGLKSGFTGREAQTIIPHQATVAFDARLVKNQRLPADPRSHPGTGLHRDRVGRRSDPGRAARPRHPGRRATRLRSGQDAGGPADLTRGDRGGGAGARRRAGGGASDHGRECAAVGVHRYPRLPTIVVPYANANNRQHSPNEHLRLDHLFQGVRTTAQLLHDVG
jgi:acetylornithine deacetylase/succinyl-diaminopimelate desuccinylase-like protein